MIKNIFSVENKIIVLTGGMGQLGIQFSKTLLEHKARVAILDVESDDQIFQDRLGIDVPENQLILIKCDITKASDISAALEIIMQKWGKAPYGLINNAALDSPPNSSSSENGPFEDYPESSWDKVMEVNVKGPFLLSKIFGKEMAINKSGSIINISSIYGLLSPNQNIYRYRQEEGKAFFKPVAYSASKSALFNLTRYLATYWAGSGVKVNTLVLAGVFNNQDKKFLNSYENNIPIGRMAAEGEYNGAILFLLSEASDYMTGSTLTIDGGWSAW
tara:strand:- start:50 stop:871 length:822 start_codon:yes stop_codon:yes gene_type:complete